jgi:hypothetical protein
VLGLEREGLEGQCIFACKVVQRRILSHWRCIAAAPIRPCEGEGCGVGTGTSGDVDGASEGDSKVVMGESWETFMAEMGRCADVETVALSQRFWG